jgi:aminotransferase
MPDFEAPPRVKGAASKAILDDFNQYETTWGSAGLRGAIAEKALRFNGIQADPKTDVTVTCGSTEAMTASIVATADFGDEVIIPEPFYENYVPATIIAGARPRHVKLAESGQSFDEEDLKATFSSRTKAIIVNTPNNPSGRVLTKGELRLVADLCLDFDAIAITDEIYEHIIYDGRKHISMASLDGMGDRTVTISGLSKTYSVTGWRVGYAIADKEITSAIRKVHDYTTVCAPTPMQKAGIEALKLPQSYYFRLAKAYQRRRDLIVKSLRNLGFRAAIPEGAYYVLADFSSISDSDDTSFARRLTRDAKVAAVPGSSFYAHQNLGRSKVRFSFAKKDRTIREAVKRLNRYAIS